MILREHVKELIKCCSRTITNKLSSHGALSKVEYATDETIETRMLIPNENDPTKIDALEVVYYSNHTIAVFIQENDGTFTPLENSNQYHLYSYESLLLAHPLTKF